MPGIMSKVFLNQIDWSKPKMPNQRICNSINSRGLKCRSWALDDESACWKHSSCHRAVRIREIMTFRTRHCSKSLIKLSLFGNILLFKSLVKSLSDDKKSPKKEKAKVISDLNEKIDLYISWLGQDDKEEIEKMTVSLKTLRRQYST